MKNWNLISVFIQRADRQCNFLTVSSYSYLLYSIQNREIHALRYALISC
jgi:hypothetical protein